MRSSNKIQLRFCRSITPETDRHALMKYYYGNNLDRLIDLKIKYDLNNVFQSGMSIPNKR